MRLPSANGISPIVRITGQLLHSTVRHFNDRGNPNTGVVMDMGCLQIGQTGTTIVDCSIIT
jgi:hypothetical protein